MPICTSRAFNSFTVRFPPCARRYCVPFPPHACLLTCCLLITPFPALSRLEYDEGSDGDFDQSLYFYEQLCKFCEDPKNAKLVDPYKRSQPEMMTALKRKQELREKVDVNFDGRVSFLYVLPFALLHSPPSLLLPLTLSDFFFHPSLAQLSRLRLKTCKFSSPVAPKILFAYCLTIFAYFNFSLLFPPSVSLFSLRTPKISPFLSAALQPSPMVCNAKQIVVNHSDWTF